VEYIKLKGQDFHDQMARGEDWLQEYLSPKKGGRKPVNTVTVVVPTPKPKKQLFEDDVYDVKSNSLPPSNILLLKRQSLPVPKEPKKYLY
jgi:hypothetical protein